MAFKRVIIRRVGPLFWLLGLMKITTLFVFIACLVISSAAEAKVGVGSWAYVLKEPNELVSGYGESIFQLEKDTFSGPLYAENDIKKVLRFTITGTSVVGTIADGKSPETTLSLEGTAVQVKAKDSPACLITIKMSNGLNYVAIELSAPSCMP
jgi:hypothetical protein